MPFIKKIGLISLGIFGLSIINFGYCDLNTLGPKVDEFNGDSTPIISSQETPQQIDGIDQGSKIFSDKLKGILRLPQKKDYTTSLGYVTALIQIAVNWLLGILASIVLVYMLYCGFLILSSGSDDKNVSKGKKGISSAAITIAGVGLSWLVISAMIWFINIISKESS